jgi:hypothetical protein
LTALALPKAADRLLLTPAKVAYPRGSGHPAPIVKRLREARPGKDFPISVRVQWAGTDRGALRALIDIYAAIGVEKFVGYFNDLTRLGNDKHSVLDHDDRLPG